mmetsp:Transcript_1309/g.2172  ORF Transcript_1309/g.2172 Transcript_1309/m.2172 type:complete len:86 (+) Transcript_1309:755-1012(+)
MMSGRTTDSGLRAGQNSQSWFASEKNGSRMLAATTNAAWTGNSSPGIHMKGAYRHGYIAEFGRTALGTEDIVYDSNGSTYATTPS